MARTSITAQKSTGAKAVRKFFNKTAPLHSPPAKQLTSNDGGSARRKSTPLESTQPVSHAAAGGEKFCCNCGEGGSMRLCDFCPRCVCSRCVMLPISDETYSNSSLQFVCPSCHLNTDKRANRSSQPEKNQPASFTPYTGLLIDSKPFDPKQGFAKVRASSLRGVFRRHDNSPLAILSLRLKTLCKTGDPSAFIKAYLRPYFPGYEQDNSLRHSSVNFDIEPNDDASLQDHKVAINDMAKRIRAQGFQRLIVTLYTHSNPENGDIHVQANGAVSISEFLDAMFDGELGRLARTTHSLLIMLVCGGVYNNPQSFDDISKFAKSGIFDNILGFDSTVFFPHQTSTLLMKLCLKVFVESYSMGSILPSILREEEGLGAHTSVLVLSPSSGKRYTWYHQQIKPMGLNLELQCAKCGRLRSCNVTFRDEYIRVCCANNLCNHRFNVPRSAWRVPRLKNMGISGWGLMEFW